MNDSTAGRHHQKKHHQHQLQQQQQQQQKQRRQQQQEDRLCNLLSSIGHLSEHGDVPVYAFGTLISTAPPQAIAEHLHQRWLADSNFSHIAPKIVLQMRSNVTVCSQVLSFALRDFNTRHDIRAQSKGMFRNFVCTLIELYPVYRQIDKCLSACLIEPIFHCLRQMVDEEPDDKDLHCLASIIINSGEQLSQLNVSECDRLVMACRRWLCSNRVPLEEDTRQLLMNVIDLWTYSWDQNLFPDCLRRHYEELEEEEKQKKRQKPTQLIGGGMHGGRSTFSSSALDCRLINSSSTANIPHHQQQQPFLQRCSSFSQQMTDSASSSLPSSAMGLPEIGGGSSAQQQQTKSLPQSRCSITTLVTTMPGRHSSAATNHHHHQDVPLALPNGVGGIADGHKGRKKLTRGIPVMEPDEERQQEEIAKNGVGGKEEGSAEGDDDKESAV